MTELTKLGESGKDHRGFSIVNFADKYGKPCSVQCSSVIDFDVEGGYEHPGTSFLWVGIDDPDPQIMVDKAKEMGIATKKKYGWMPYPLPEEVLVSTRMHLDREQVAGLIARLQEWLANGRFE